MDTVHGFDDRLDSDSYEADDGAVTDNPLGLGGDERRMHVRAYNHWVSLLHDRPYPSIEDLEPDNIVDFGPHSVLIDFTRGVEDPTIRYLGHTLREECGIDADIRRVADVPSRSLLSRLTDHYLQIIANRAPIGFEAEFVGIRGFNTLYRGILMPFSSNDETIDFIYGVINWKEIVDENTQAMLDAEIEEACRTPIAPAPAPTAIWADGPGSSMVADLIEDTGDFAADDLDGDDDIFELTAEHAANATLADRLALARESAAAALASDVRSRGALYRALGRAYDFALAAELDLEAYAEILEDAGLKAQPRAPMTPMVKLVFGVDYDKTRLTEFATVLSAAHRQSIAPGGLEAMLETAEGGIKGVVKAERALRRPAASADRFAVARAELMARPPIAQVAIDAGDAEWVVLLARRDEGGTVSVVANLGEDKNLVERAVRRAAA